MPTDNHTLAHQTCTAITGDLRVTISPKPRYWTTYRTLSGALPILKHTRTLTRPLPFLQIMVTLSKAVVAVETKTPAYVQSSPNSVIAGSIAPPTTLGRSNFIHFRNTLFELFILAFLVRMSLILSIGLARHRVSCSLPYIPRISKAGRILRSDID